MPERTVGDQVVAARNDVDAALVLGATAAFVWRALSEWSSPADLSQALAAQHPDVPAAERDAALAGILEQLDEAELLERAP